MWYTCKANVITLHVYVQPGAKSTEITGFYDGLLKVRLAARAIKGRANEALQKFIALLFQVPIHQVKLVYGDKNKRKTMEIIGSLINPEHLLLKVGKE
ncbi:TPA: DUF167 domain-containing protein [Legionella pneumophila]|nr:DUF167 domain-containing protein [Legionella pneumophila]HAU1500471.1 DUF167 domain-containing protein [Legionella pneumophila]HAU1519465.1 DUF167 domain-containing protein [Legionella pneumophila]